jgi:putative sterol carrier protein
MTFDELTQEIRRRASEGPTLGHTVRIDVDDAGTIYWDGTVVPAEVSNAEREAETTLRMSADALARIMAGELDPTMAYMMGKLKVEGSLGVAMKISGLLGD